MLTRIIVQLVGFLLSLAPMLLMFCRLLKNGWRHTFQTRPHSMPAVLEDPKHGTHGFVKGSGGVQLHYVEKGDNTKPLMLFIHGFPEFWFSWRFQLAHFSSDYWCVAFDTRGYNDSSKPEGIQSYNIGNLAADVKAVIEGLGRTKCNVLVAHDWGGTIGYAFCDKYPDMADQYITFNIPHPKSFENNGGLKQKLMSWYMIFLQCPILPELFFKSSDYALLEENTSLMADSNEKLEELKEAYKYAFRDPASVTASINYYRSVIQYQPEGFFEEPIKVPVFSIFGKADKFLSVESAEGSKDYVKTFKQEFVEGVGHWSQMEDPDKANLIMRNYLSKEL